MSTAWNSTATDVSLTLSNGNLTVTAGGTQQLTLGFALDFTHSKVWFYNPNAGNWNNSGTANPATNTGGLALGPTGPLTPAYAPHDTGEQATINGGTAAFVNPIPSGFTPLDTAVSATTTWSATLKNVSITLSNGNKTATSTSGGYRGVLGNQTINSGLVYFEITSNADSTNYEAVYGFGNTSASLSTYIGADGNSEGYQGSSGNIIYNNAAAATYATFTNAYTYGSAIGTTSHGSGKWYLEMEMVGSGGSSPYLAMGLCIGAVSLQSTPDQVGRIYYDATGHVFYDGSASYTDSSLSAGNIIGIALDLTNNLVWFRNPTGAWNGSTNTSIQNPVTATGGINIATLAGLGALFPFAALENNSSNQIILNTVTPFNTAAPSGFAQFGGNTTTGVRVPGFVRESLIAPKPAARVSRVARETMVRPIPSTRISMLAREALVTDIVPVHVSLLVRETLVSTVFPVYTWNGISVG